MSDKINVGIAFGGVSVEHEVSVITGLQAAAALDESRYEPIPLYISKHGVWYTGAHLLDVKAYQSLDGVLAEAEPAVLVPSAAGKAEILLGDESFFGKRRRRRIDVLFIGLHGAEGENGALQGLCETYNIPYTGSGVMGSAVGMDKVVSKQLARDAGIPVVAFVEIRQADWIGAEEGMLDRCEAKLGFPVIVKPARLGSSVGIKRAESREELDTAVEDAFGYDDKVIVEEAVSNLREINCAVLGSPDNVLVSVLEEPVRSSDAALLSYEEKYTREEEAKGTGGAKGQQGEGMASMDRIIPARLEDEMTKSIRRLAAKVFKAFECAGVARIDWMINDGTKDLYFNEINTIPGSLSFYLMEPTGVSFQDLVSRMIDLAIDRKRQKNAKTRSYETNLLALKSIGGAKSVK